jgi:hypothetical protein
MYIDRRVFDWLKWIGYKQSDIVADDQEQEAVQLTPHFTNGLFRAYEFKEILERVSILYEIPFIKQQMLSNITMGETVSQQRHNWELVIDFLAGVGFRMDQMLQRELQSPNEMAMRGFLADLMDFFPIITGPREGTEPTASKLNHPDSESMTIKPKMGDRTFNDHFDEGKVGGTTAVGMNKNEQHFKSRDR